MTNNFIIKRIDVTSTRDSTVVENAELAKSDLKLECVNATTEDEIIEAGKDADVILTRAAKMSRYVIERLPKLQAIVRYGIGYDTIDLDGATDNGVMAVNVPDFCYEEVSNHAIGMLLICARKLAHQSNTMKNVGYVEARNLLAPTGSITGQTLGIIGCGNIGRMVALKAKVFGLNIIGYDPHVDTKLTDAAGITLKSLQEILKESDYFTLHPFLWHETFHILSEKEFKMMKPTAYVINTSRGPVIDQKALIKALQEKWISGAGIDVFEKEPIDLDDPLLKMDNVILTPHTAFYSDASDKRVRTCVAQEAARVFHGHLPKNVVNKEVKPKANLTKGE